MIYPTDEQLLAGIAEALKDTVLPDLARGTAAQKQLQAAIETLRRMAFTAPGRDAAMEADNADMESVLSRIGEIFAEAGHSPPPNPPPSRGRGHAVPGGGDVATRAVDENRALQAALADIQARIPASLEAQITPLFIQLYARMTDRAMALIPPPMPRTPRTPA